MAHLGQLLMEPVGTGRLPFSPFEIALPTTVGAAFLYRKGSKERTGKPDNFGRAAWVLLESALMVAISTTVDKVYRILGILKGFYEAGHAGQWRERVEAVLQTAVMFSMGLLGIKVGAAWSYAARKSHTDKIKMFFAPGKNAATLHAEGMEALDTIMGTKTGVKSVSPESWEALQKPLRYLKQMARTLKLDSQMSLKQMSELSQETQKAQQAFLEQYAKQFGETPEEAFPRLKQTIHHYLQAGHGNKHMLAKSLQSRAPDQLAERLARTVQAMAACCQSSMSYEAIRMLNPVFGYFLALLAGLGLAKGVSKLLYMGASPEEAARKHPPHLDIPMLLGHIATNASLDSEYVFPIDGPSLLRNHGT
jgi:hypothetical protein